MSGLTKRKGNFLNQLPKAFILLEDFNNHNTFRGYKETIRKDRTTEKTLLTMNYAFLIQKDQH